MKEGIRTNNSDRSPSSGVVPVAIVIPACNEESCLGQVIESLKLVCDRIGAVVAVGLNATTDDSADIADQAGAIVGETSTRGYGHGCIAAIDAICSHGLRPEAYLFVAGDGAHGPDEVEAIWRAYIEQPEVELALGERTWGTGIPGHPRSFERTLPNILLGLWATLLSGHVFYDLGPLRVIRRELFEAIEPVELVWGWTIEVQVAAGIHGAAITRIPLGERSRIAGEQKVSGLGIGKSIEIGREIARAGLRARKRAFAKLSFRAG